MELPDMVVMHVFSHESVFSELDLTALGVPGVVCSIDSVLLLVEARLDTSRVAVRTSNTLHSLSRSLLSSCSTFSWKRRVRRRKHESGGWYLSRVQVELAGVRTATRTLRQLGGEFSLGAGARRRPPGAHLRLDVLAHPPETADVACTKVQSLIDSYIV
jgi:hypothetical protein